MKRYNFITITGILILLLVVGGLYFASTAQTQSVVQGNDNVPQVIQSPTNTLFSYQGELLDTAGDPINNAAMPMRFKLYSAATGGSACWTENQTVEMVNGRFHVNIGSITPIPDTCLGNDIYLELAINGETLAPRELLTSVAYAVEANTLPHEATTRGLLNIAPGPDGEGGQIQLLQGDSGNDWNIDNRLGTFRLFHDGQVYFSVKSDGDVDISNGDVNINGHKIEGVGGIIGQVTSGGNMYFDLTEGSAIAFRDRTVSPSQEMFKVSRNGDTIIHGNLDLRGSCTASAAPEDSGIASAADPTCTGGSLTTGALVEANLQTSEELQADKIERFSLGDILCISPESGQMELCTVPNNRLVQAVANRNGKPVIMGAEPIKIIGPAQIGDILVTSSVPGYAMVNNNPAPGTVIGQALEDFDGESGLIKAMIRKW